MKKIAPIMAWLFLLLAAIPFQAKDWRGIIPLHSTREDVRKILGKPLSTSAKKHVERYRINDEFVFVEYAFGPCDLIGDNWGVFNVPEWTVHLIRVEFVDHGIPLDKIGTPHVDTLERVPSSSGDIDYYDREQGLAYTVRKGDVIGMDYAPSSAENHLRCQSKRSSHSARNRTKPCS
jgi:hypothetical protein